MSTRVAQCLAYLDDGRVCRAPAAVLDHQRGGLICADCHRRQVLDDQVGATRAVAALRMTPAVLLAYGRAELERLALDASSDPEPCPFCPSERHADRPVEQTPGGEAPLKRCWNSGPLRGYPERPLRDSRSGRFSAPRARRLDTAIWWQTLPTTRPPLALAPAALTVDHARSA